MLPSALFFIAVATIFLYTKLEKRVKTLFEEKEFTIREALLLVIAMGGMVTVLVIVPSQAILALFLFAFSSALFMATYLISQKWYLGFISPAVFIALYFLFKDTSIWRWYLLDLFAVIFVVSITVYIGSFFTWKTTFAFAVFLTIMDIIQVLGTQYMITTSMKLINLSLPILIVVPVVPSLEFSMALGLGDLFLTGLLGIQTAKKYGKRTAMLAVLSMATVFGIVEAFMLTYFPEQALPATVMIFGGWLIALTINYREKIASDQYLTEITTFTVLAIMGIIGALAQSIWWLLPSCIFSLLAMSVAIEYKLKRVKSEK
jgi:presenilin-like A22 family membrane protease